MFVEKLKSDFGILERYSARWERLMITDGTIAEDSTKDGHKNLKIGTSQRDF